MVTTPGRRLALGAVATGVALALLFSYRTSTSPTPPVAEPAVTTPNQQTDGPRHRLVPDVTLDTAEPRPGRAR